MIVANKILTKANWQLAVRPNGIPILGYYRKTPEGIYPYDSFWDDDEKNIKLLPKGHNLILKGKLYLNGSGRGRSDIHFYLQDQDENNFHTTASGFEKLIHAIAYKDFKCYVENEKTCIEGKWTCQKQGNEVGLFPVLKG